MTIGELAALFNKILGLGAALDVVPLKGWRRIYDETRLPWVIHHPNIPTIVRARCCWRARCCRKVANTPPVAEADRCAVKENDSRYTFEMP